MNDEKVYEILIIDDSPADRRVFKRFLEEGSSVKLNVVEAGNGKAGISHCLKHSPDCVILDFKLPDSSGLQIIAKLREFCRAPVIFVTGQPLPLTQSHAYKNGVVRYLSKNIVTSEILQNTVLEVLKQEGSRA